MEAYLDTRAVINRCRRRRWHGPIQVVILTVVVTIFVIICTFLQEPHDTNQNVYRPRLSRSLLTTTDLPFNESDFGNVTQKGDPLFPADLFTEGQLRKGAFLFHIFGMIYMFVALAMVCDEFFVPALDVIIEKLGISEDVAGATFMAAGGSAPELFTSVIGVFISFNDVGIGTIVGSAVFNILFVIAMCVLFSRTVLELTWWPLFRDVTFYSVALLMLVYFFTDTLIYWYEALMMFIIYLLYCSFMKINGTVERFVKKHLNKNKHGTASGGAAGPGAQPGVIGGLPGPGLPGLALAGGSGMRRPSAAAPVIHSGSKFRHGLLQLMIHTIDPLHDGNVDGKDGGKVDEKATQLHAIASLKVLLDATNTKPQNGRVQTYRSDGTPMPPGAGGPDCQRDVQSQGTEVTHIDSIASSDVASSGMHHPNGDLPLSETNSISNNVSHVGVATGSVVGGRKRLENNGLNSNIPPIPEDASESPPPPPMSPLAIEQEEDDENKPIDLTWPNTWRKRLTYIFVAPIILPLWITLPDTRTPRGKRFFVVTFFGSILWIAIFSYLMVWWASTVGDTLLIPAPVMGLTILAAGTSVPDLITSVIVARKGFGDMAVSSSVGSNIFDVCVGLPVPWLIKALVDVIANVIKKKDPFDIKPIEVTSDGLACSVMLLFTMLMFVIISIAVSKWKMSKGLGLFMFVLYFIFVAVSLSLSYRKIICPI